MEQSSPDNFKWYQELISFFVKYWILIMLIAFGVATNIATKVFMKVKYTIWEWIALFIISSFSGILSAVYCYYKGYLTVKEGSDTLPIGLAIVPVMTLIGERLIMWFMSNYDWVFKGLFKWLVNSMSSLINKKDESDNH